MKNSADNMLQYLIILLDATSTSFCHYNNNQKEHSLISIDILKQGIRFGMKENLMIQFVYPNYIIPDELKKEIKTIDHYKIVPSSIADDEADVIVVDDWNFAQAKKLHKPTTFRVSKDEFFVRYMDIIPLLKEVPTLNVVFLDIDRFDEEDFELYKKVLKNLSAIIETIYIEEGQSPQINILTDRMVLKGMNNCGAGDTAITLAPNGKFYICPAFYYDDSNDSVGDIKQGLRIRNKQLYKLEYSPICRRCDTWQCKRCIWLNKKTTLEVNTPSHEQCVVAHLERNASKELLANIRKKCTFLPEQEEISEIDYLDPFEKIKLW